MLNEIMYKLLKYGDIRQNNEISILNQSNFISTKMDRLNKSLVDFNKSLYCKRYEMAKPIFDVLNMELEYVNIKGFVNAFLAYDDIGKRPSGDIDILIERCSAKRITEILCDMGFVRGSFNDENKLIEYSRESIIFYSANTHQIAPFIKETGDLDIPFLCIDVNTKLDWGENKRFNIPVHEFLADREKMLFQGVEFYRLSYEKIYIQTILHCYKEINSVFLLQKNGGYRVKEFVDIYGLYLRLGRVLDFQFIKHLINRYDIECYILYVLKIVSVIFSEPDIYNLVASGNEKVNTGIYGLEESHEWKLEIEERFYSEQASKAIKQNLTEKDLRSIDMNNRYI